MDRLEKQRREEQKQREYQHAQVAGMAADTDESGQQADPQQPMFREGPKVGRNDPCPCGSGKKYKQCHGRI
jgi:preprotein translocase subunit SecA